MTQARGRWHAVPNGWSRDDLLQAIADQVSGGGRTERRAVPRALMGTLWDLAAVQLGRHEEPGVCQTTMRQLSKELGAPEPLLRLVLDLMCEVGTITYAVADDRVRTLEVKLLDFAMWLQKSTGSPPDDSRRSRRDHQKTIPEPSGTLPANTGNPAGISSHRQTHLHTDQTNHGAELVSGQVEDDLVSRNAAIARDLQATIGLAIPRASEVVIANASQAWKRQLTPDDLHKHVWEPLTIAAQRYESSVVVSALRAVRESRDPVCSMSWVLHWLERNARPTPTPVHPDIATPPTMETTHG